MKSYTLAQKISQEVLAVQKFQQKHSRTWEGRHRKALSKLMELMPSGPNFSFGQRIQIDVQKSTNSKLVFYVDFRHINKRRIGWSQHEVVVSPTFIGYKIKVGGRNRNNVKVKIEQAFQKVLTQLIKN